MLYQMRKGAGMVAMETIDRLKAAFQADGFVLKRFVTSNGGAGALAAHKTAANYDTKQKKLCYYLEGTPYARGYAMGLLAEPQVADMAVNFTDNVVFDFVGLELLALNPLLPKLLVALLYELSQSAWLSQPDHIHEEVQGLYDGCVKANPRTKVTLRRLVVMNVAFDVLCAIVYTGFPLRERAPEARPEHLRLSMMCNAFSAFRSAAGGGHYFARDFMFSTGGVLQNNLAHVISIPAARPGACLSPLVSLSAPGFAGSISVMNGFGVAGGVNMSPAGNCDAKNVGTNSLLLLRECAMRGKNLHEAASVLQNAKRGVSWNYALSDGKLDAACAAEAGASQELTDGLSFPPRELLPLLPDRAFFKEHPAFPIKNGVALRMAGAPCPDAYLRFNGGLWDSYKRERDASVALLPGALLPGGLINPTPHSKNCPSNFYFAPARACNDVLITGNHFISPEMRLCAMDPWTARVTLHNVNDIQWRYDELNRQLRQTLVREGSIGYASAKRLAEFLAPYGEFPKYYAKNPKSRDKRATRIEGCVSVFDLKRTVMESHYGYYEDDWIKTSLKNYLGT